MDLDLDRIIEQCKANDHKAFEIVYRKYYRVLLGIALRYSGSVQEAEDVLQDSFIKIFHSIGSYHRKGSFEGWIKRIVQNTAINSYKSKLKFELYIDVSDIGNKISDDNFNSIFEAFDERDIIGLLNKMPGGYRLVINLYFVDGYSHKEIAEMLNITIGTSKSQLFKAKNYLKNLIEIHNQEKIV
jgi:RNA polymerase sigma factor (sigma-70 family)